MESLGRTLVIAGLVLAGLGVVIWLASGLPWLGRLPGDVRIERPGFRLYLPITSCLILSVVVSLALGLFSRLR